MNFESKRKPPREPYPVALAMLARRPYSIAELRRALERKFPSHPGISDALARLRTLGYLDDKKFAEHVASSLARNRAFGRHRIRRELKAKLVDYKYIEPALERAFEESDEHDLLMQSLEKRVRFLRRPITASKVNALCRALLRRGFRAGDIINALRSRPDLRPVSEDLNPASLEEEEKD